MSADKLHYVVYGGYLSTRCKLKLNHTIFWAVLIRESAAGPKRISFYNNHAEFVTGLQPQFFLEFRNILHVQQVEAKGRGKIWLYRFKIISTSSNQLFATKTAEECQKWVKNMTELMQGIPEPNVVYEFQILVLPGGHVDKLNLSGSYILKVFDNSLQLFSASGAIPTDFHCSLENATVFCTATNIHGSEEGMLMIQTSRNANIGEGELAFSTKSAVDITRVVEHRKKCIPKEVATLKEQRSISLPDLGCESVTDASLPHSGNTCPDPKLPADVSQHQCYPDPMKPQRQSVPIFPLHALFSTLSHDSVPGNDKIPMQPNSPQLPSPTKCWKPIPPPKPWSKPASPNPSRGRPLSPHPDIKLSGSHSNNQISTNETTPPTLKSPPNSARVLLPVPHHHIPTHSTKFDVGDSTKSSTASPKKVARFPPKEQVKVDKYSDSEPKSAKGGSRNEAAQKRFMYLNKSTGDSGDYEINDIGIGNGNGNGNSSSILVKKNLAYRLIDVGIDDKSPPLVVGGELDDDGYVDMLIGKEKLPSIGEKSTPGELDGYDYVDIPIGKEKLPSIGEKSTPGELDGYDYVDMPIDNTAKSKRYGYMSESAPHIHKQSESKIRRSNSDVSSRGSVSRKGTIKVYKDPQHTISTQRQLSVEDLTTMHVQSK